MAGPRTKALDRAGVAERAGRARFFLDVAGSYTVEQRSAARAVGSSNAIEAGIAAADAICGRLLGERSNSERHADAVDLLRRALPKQSAPASALRRLLDVKTRVQYGENEVGLVAASENLQRAEALVEAMEQVLAIE